MTIGESLRCIVKVGDLVRLKDDPQWGVGIILAERSIGGFFAYFPQECEWESICSEHFPNQKVEVISESR